jgi:hypothetical protein
LLVKEDLIMKDLIKLAEDIREQCNHGASVSDIVDMIDSHYQPINIVFDGPPSHESGRFVEVETLNGESINAGEWTKREDGLWSLTITSLPPV